MADDNANHDGAGTDLADEKTIQLRKPVSLGNGDKAVVYVRLDLREPTAGELARAMKAGNSVEVVIMLISIVAQIPRSAVEKLCQRDLEEASDFLAGFAGAGPATGGMSSPI